MWMVSLGAPPAWRQTGGVFTSPSVFPARVGVSRGRWHPSGVRAGLMAQLSLNSHGMDYGSTRRAKLGKRSRNPFLDRRIPGLKTSERAFLRPLNVRRPTPHALHRLTQRVVETL